MCLHPPLVRAVADMSTVLAAQLAAETGAKEVTVE